MIYSWFLWDLADNIAQVLQQMTQAPLFQNMSWSTGFQSYWGLFTQQNAHARQTYVAPTVRNLRNAAVNWYRTKRPALVSTSPFSSSSSLRSECNMLRKSVLVRVIIVNNNKKFFYLNKNTFKIILFQEVVKATYFFMLCWSTN